MDVSGQVNRNSGDFIEIFGENISREELEQITASAKRVFEASPEIGMTTVSLTETKKAKFVSYKNENFFLVDDEGKELGRGNFIVAKEVRTYSLKKMTHKVRASMLTPKGELIPKDLSNDDIIHHNSILSMIHQNGYVPGVVKPNHMAKNSDNRVGIYMKRYEGSLVDCCVPYDNSNFFIKKHFALLDFLKGCRVLLEALKIIHSLGIYHRDIKPANILYLGNKLDFTDFAGARTSKEIKEVLDRTDIEDMVKCSKISGFTSPLYTNFGDKDRLSTLICHNNLPEISRLFEKADIYAFGKTIFEIITRKTILWGQAYKGITLLLIHEKQDYSAFMNLIENNLKGEGCSENLIKLIKMMVEPFYLKRISSSEAKVLLDAVINALEEPTQKK